MLEQVTAPGASSADIAVVEGSFLEKNVKKRVKKGQKRGVFWTFLPFLDVFTVFVVFTVFYLLALS